MLWPLLVDEWSQYALLVAERFVEGKASESELQAVRCSARSVPNIRGAYWASEALSSLITFLGGTARARRPRVRHTVDGVFAQNAARAAREAAGQDNWIEARRQQVELLCDMLGHLLRTLTIDPAWLRWNGGVVPKMAQTIYDRHHYTDLPIMADALEDAGCTDADILIHCRSETIHQRGCWVIDLILGKE
jgi:hypothetical protein